MRENLKNVLLFMASSGYLVPPSRDASKEAFWTETWKRIDRFVPDLRNDLALDEPAAEPEKQQPQAEGSKEEAPAAEEEKKQEA